jgi:3-oxoacyl-[acyl-carrier protein] reductase
MTSPRPSVTVVTGASGALGSAMVTALLEAGHRVVGIDRVDARAVVQAGLRDDGEHPGLKAGDDYVHLVADVCDTEQVDACARPVASFGEVAHLVGVAGGAVTGEAMVEDPADVTPEMFRASVELNLVSQFVVVRAFLPSLRAWAAKTGDASITLISSINGVVGMAMPGYSAAKAGLLGLVRVLAGQLGADGVRVNAVVPGTVRTPRTARAWAHDPQHFDALAARAALHRLTSPEEVAAAALSLVGATGITGQDLVVDSGQTSTWTT